MGEETVPGLFKLAGDRPETALTVLLGRTDDGVLDTILLGVVGVDLLCMRATLLGLARLATV